MEDNGMRRRTKESFLLALIALGTLTLFQVIRTDYTRAYTSPIYFALHLPIFFHVFVVMVSFFVLGWSNKRYMCNVLTFASTSLYLLKSILHHVALKTLLLPDSYDQYATAWAFEDRLIWEIYSYWPGFPLTALTVEDVTSLTPFGNALLILLVLRTLEVTAILAFARRFFGEEAGLLSTFFLSVLQPYYYHLNAASLSSSIALLAIIMFLRYLLSSDDNRHFLSCLLLSLILTLYHGGFPLFLAIAIIAYLIALALIHRILPSTALEVTLPAKAKHLAFIILVAWSSWYMYSVSFHFSLIISQQIRLEPLVPSSRALPGMEQDFDIMFIATKIVSYIPILISLPLLLTCVRALVKQDAKRFHVVVLALFAATSVLGMMNFVSATGYEWRIGSMLYTLLLPMLCGVSLTRIHMSSRAAHRTMCAFAFPVMILSLFTFEFSGHVSFAGLNIYDEATGIYLANYLTGITVTRDATNNSSPEFSPHRTHISLTGDNRYIEVSEFFAYPTKFYSSRYRWAGYDLMKAILENERITSTLVASNKMTPLYFASYGVMANRTLTFINSLHSNRDLNLVYNNAYSVIWWNSFSHG